MDQKRLRNPAHTIARTVIYHKICCYIINFPIKNNFMLIDFRDRFSFNSFSHDLWPVYNAIKEYYPIGIARGEGGGIFFQYPGLKKLEEIVIENVHNESNYKKRWKDFTKELSINMGKEVVGTTFGQAPSFSSYLIMEKNDFKNGSNNKQIHFAVSLLGNFYTIYGLDVTTVYDPEKSYRKAYRTANALTASPHQEYKNDFVKLESIIREKYPEHKMIPYAFGQKLIDGLRVRYSDAEVCSVYMALFDDTLQIRNNFHYTQGFTIEHTRGNIYYGMDDWIKTNDK
ncbi:MAG: hypothetical protein KJO53_15645 [Eudoraea sp.]|nr:hypothetical protein [Eudoraea sp.]